MERNERRRADDLDRYWDAVIRGSYPTPARESIPDLANFVETLQSAKGPAPTLFPDPEHAWRELRRAPVPSVRPWPHPNGRGQEHLERRSSTRSRLTSPRWMVAQLATAAVVLLSLIGFIVLRQQSLQTREEAWSPAFVKALSSVSGEVVDHVLVNAKFTAEELPSGNKESIYYRLTLQPGVSFSALAAPAWCGCRTDLISKGVGVEVVQSGSYGLRLDAPIRVQRNGEREVSTVPAQTEVILGPGDAVIYPDYAAVGEIRNAGNDPVELVGFTIFGTDDTDIPAPALPKDVRMELLTYALPYDWDKLPVGPIAVSVRRLTLPPGESVGPYTPVGLEAMLVEQGTTYRYYYPPGEDTPGASPLYRGEGQVHPIVGLSSGARTKIEIGDEPVQLLVVLIEPAGISFESLAP